MNSQKERAAAKQTNEENKQKAAALSKIITSSKYNMYMKLPLQDRQFIEHHLALAEVT